MFLWARRGCLEQPRGGFIQSLLNPSSQHMHNLCSTERKALSNEKFSHYKLVASSLLTFSWVGRAWYSHALLMLSVTFLFSLPPLTISAPSWSLFSSSYSEAAPCLWLPPLSFTEPVLFLGQRCNWHWRHKEWQIQKCVSCKHKYIFNRSPAVTQVKDAGRKRLWAGRSMDPTLTWTYNFGLPVK